MTTTRTFFVLLVLSFTAGDDEIWEQDLSSDMRIGLSMTGYQSVDLKCGADAFFVNVTVDNNFDGVLYTRGDFKTKHPDCFQTAGNAIKNGVLFRLKIPFEKCHTLEDASDQQFINTLIIQHDSELIMPGDAAFRLSCAFNPEQKLTSTILAVPKSKISLVDADPAVKPAKSSKFEAESQTDHVSFPQKATKDEL